jgi:hypothetical protein
MELSKREYKFRQKIINEYHYKKDEQKMLDNYIKKSKFWDTYYKVYKGRKSLCSIFADINLKRSFNQLSMSLKDFGISVKDAFNNFKNLGDILNDVSKVWGITDKT